MPRGNALSAHRHGEQWPRGSASHPADATAPTGEEEPRGIGVWLVRLSTHRSRLAGAPAQSPGGREGAHYSPEPLPAVGHRAFLAGRAHWPLLSGFASSPSGRWPDRSGWAFLPRLSIHARLVADRQKAHSQGETTASRPDRHLLFRQKFRERPVGGLSSARPG